MGKQPPGPLCTTRVGDTWIDGGTTCRTQTGVPGTTGMMQQLFEIEWRLASKSKAKFDREHVYSMAPEAVRKRDIDLQIIDDDYNRGGEIRLDNPDYLKSLIRIGSGGKKEVSSGAKKIQFFIIRGGAEGFLPAKLANKDARDVVLPGKTTRGGPPSEFHFDDNDMLVVFDPKGKLIGAALLRRPTLIIGGDWTEETSTIIYNTWDNKGVSIYKNNNPKWSIHYLALVVDDGMKGPGKHHGWIDMHKKEATNGCIFIMDANAPPYHETVDAVHKLNAFEPKLLIDILASIGKRPDQVKGNIDLGIMHLVDI